MGQNSGELEYWMADGFLCWGKLAKGFRDFTDYLEYSLDATGTQMIELLCFNYKGD